jgi:tetratricopeptide (TPR) repeat protein
MFAVYLLTLNPWVAPESLELVADVSGLSPRVKLLGPVTWLVTWPFRWLPLTWIPPALNLFSAACAALSLAWLARSVALLPHDRTGSQRRRLRAGRPWLTMRGAWLPPTLAVLVCGLQLTFWEHAVAATGEMFNLLLFAWLVRSLLELRADGNPARLPRFALVGGLAVANNWAVAAFAPLFCLAAVWAARANPFSLPVLARALKGFKDRNLSPLARFRQGLEPFNPGLWVRSLGCFLAGLSLLVLLPLGASLADNAQMDFWTALRSVLRFYKRFLLAVPIFTVLLLSLGSVLPAVFMALRWGSRVHVGRTGDRLVAVMFHGLHAFFLTACLWAALDLPLSPRRLGVGFPFLPLYYLGALSAGYFSGYFLLVFGTPRRHTLRWTSPLRRVVNVALTAAIWLALAGVPGLMLHQSLPYILWTRTGPLKHFATQVERCLPPPGAVILGDSSFSLLCLQTTLIRHGQQSAYLPVDVSALEQDPGYFDFLRQRHPEFNLSPPWLRLYSELTNPVVQTAWLEDLLAAREVFSLRPFFGYLGESFCCQPRGLFYQLKRRGANVLEDGPLPPEVLAQNRAFWDAFITQPLPELVRHLPTPWQLAQPRPLQRLHQKASRGPERDPWAAVFGGFYARALDNWGVELQKAGWLREAGNCFDAALQLSTDSVAAQINRSFNQSLQAHKPGAIQSAQKSDAQLGKRRSWNQVLSLDGSVDEPNACYKAGAMFAEANLPCQAAQQFARAQTLAPGQTDAALRLAEQLIRLADYTNALAAANQALQLNPLDPDALFWKGCSLMMLKDYGSALPLLDQSLTTRTDSRTAQALGFTQVQLGNLDAARQAYERIAQSGSNAYLGYFRLAQVAYHQKDTNAAIKYVELYRSNTPPNLLDSPLVDAILAELRGPAAGAAKP